MKKPIPDDYGLTQEDIGWGVVRQKDIDELDYKQFVNKTWLGLIVVGTIISAFVGITRCAQSSSCILDTLIFAGKVALFSGIIMYWPALLFGIIAKWVYEFSAKRDDRLQRFQEYKNSLARYKSISDEDVASDYGDFIHEHYQVDKIWDVSKLPHPKERIMDALCRLNAKETSSDEQKKAISITFLYLAQFQEGVGENDLDQTSKLMKMGEDHKFGKINREEMAQILKEVEKDNKLYEKHNVQVMEEMMETLPKKLIEGTARALNRG